jgi:hypothetical protein
MEQTLSLNLTVNEINGIIQVLGQLPTSSNAYPLLLKIKEQAESQVKKQAPNPAPASTQSSAFVPPTQAPQTVPFTQS